MFVYQSSLLTLGILSKKIYPVTISLEIIITTINGQKFSLLSMEDHNSTYLLDDKIPQLLISTEAALAMESTVMPAEACINNRCEAIR